MLFATEDSLDEEKFIYNNFKLSFEDYKSTSKQFADGRIFSTYAPMMIPQK